MQIQCPGRQRWVSVICFLGGPAGGPPGVALSQPVVGSTAGPGPRPLRESVRGSSAVECRLCLGLDSTEAVPRVRLGRTHTSQHYLEPQGLPLPRRGQPASAAARHRCRVAGAGPEPPVGLSHIGRLLRFLPASVSFSSLPGIPFTTSSLCCGLEQLGGVFQAQV